MVEGPTHLLRRRASPFRVFELPSVSPRQAHRLSVVVGLASERLKFLELFPMVITKIVEWPDKFDLTPEIFP